jgi:hypothetical protein
MATTPYERFQTDYTESDPGSDISVDSETKLTVTTLDRGQIDAYVYKDAGANYFDGDWEFLFDLKISLLSNIAIVMVSAVANGVDDFTALDAATSDAAVIQLYGLASPPHRVYTVSLQNGQLSTSAAATILQLNTQYYCKFTRDDDAGPTGTQYIYVYDDAERTNLVGSTSVACKNLKADYRYAHAVMSYGAASTYNSSFLFENWDIGEDYSIAGGSNPANLFFEFF